MDASFGTFLSPPKNPQVVTDDEHFGVKTNRFGFTIAGYSNVVVVVQAATNLANPLWLPVQTNILTGGTAYFSDPQWADHRDRFYRLCAP